MDVNLMLCPVTTYEHNKGALLSAFNGFVIYLYNCEQTPLNGNASL